MTSPTINGTKRPTVPTFGPITRIHLGGLGAATPEPTPAPEPIAEPVNHPEPTVDYVALAEAERIRKIADAEAEALRIEAEAKAEAERIRAVEDTRKQKLANDKAEQTARERAAASEARIADANRRREEAERAAEQARAAEEAQQAAEAERAAEVATADAKWRKYAIRFAIVCAIVALPVQMNAFWNKQAPWLIAAPLMLEGGSWVVQRGAAAAVANRRPLWHYRIVAWLLALIAAGINLWHGMNAFDPATAIATAFASIAGPGVWDLHEHGRIRKRDGVLPRRERKAQERAEKAAAAEKAAREAAVKAEKAAAAKAAEEAAEKLAQDRQERFETEWEHALELAAALGETAVTETVWRRAWRDIHGTEPGESVDIIRGRNAAARRLAAAVSETPGNTPSKVTNAQRANQMPRTQRGPARRPPVRRVGDTEKYVPAARRQASITAKSATQNTPGEDS